MCDAVKERVLESERRKRYIDEQRDAAARRHSDHLKYALFIPSLTTAVVRLFVIPTVTFDFGCESQRSYSTSTRPNHGPFRPFTVHVYRRFLTLDNVPFSQRRILRMSSASLADDAPIRR